MLGTFGPVLTTGVALAAAAVVVANPVIAPRSDVQVPVFQLSAGSGDALGMLDEDFLNAIAPAPPQSDNPFVILKDLISGLAANATDFGKNAIVEAFVAGATVAVTQPELTAVSVPYVPAPPVASTDIAAFVPPSAPSLDAFLPPPISLPTAAIADITPIVAEVLRSVVNDVSFVGNELVVAAFAAGAVLAAEPRLIIDTLRALAEGDVRGAPENAVKVVVAPLGPPQIVINAIRTVVERHLPAAPAVPVPITALPLPANSVIPVPVSRAVVPGAVVPGAVVPATATVATPATDTGGPDTRPRRGVAADNAVLAPRAAARAAADTAREVTTTAVDGATELAESAEVGPTRATGRPGRLGSAVTAVQEQAQSGLRDVADSVRKGIARPGRTAPGPAGE